MFDILNITTHNPPEDCLSFCLFTLILDESLFLYFKLTFRTYALQKRSRREDGDVSSVAGCAGSDDMDEYEMMNVRGGSPPPGGVAPPSSGSGGQRFSAPDWDLADGPAVGPGAALGGGGGGYESQQDPYSSYDSYSDEEVSAPGLVNQRHTN